MQDPIFFGDFLTANPADPDVMDPKIYEDCGNYEKVT